MVIFQPAGMGAKVNPGDPDPTGVHRSLAFVKTEFELCFHSGALVHPKYKVPHSCQAPKILNAPNISQQVSGFLGDCNNT